MKLNPSNMVAAFYMLLESCELQDRTWKYVNLKGCDCLAVNYLVGVSLQAYCLREAGGQVASAVKHVWVCQSGPRSRVFRAGHYQAAYRV